MNKKTLLRSVRRAKEHSLFVAINEIAKLMALAVSIPYDVMINIQPMNEPSGIVIPMDVYYGPKQKATHARRSKSKPRAVVEIGRGSP